MNDLIDPVIDDIYQACFDAGSFQKMFEQICGLLDAPQGCVMILGKGSSISYIHNINPESQRAYNTAYIGEDPWYRQAVARGLQKVVVTGQELLPTREFRRTGFYHDVMASSDIYDCMSITLEDCGSDNAGLILYRSKSQPFFGPREKALFGALLPHLRRMVRMRRLFEERQFMQALDAEALDHLSFGVVFLDHDGTLSLANRAAEAVLSAHDGLGLRRGRLVAIDTEDDERLAQGIGWALGTARGPFPASVGDIAIRRRSGRTAYALQILPVTLESAEPCLLTHHVGTRRAIVVVTDPEGQKKPPVALLQQMFGLTPAEASLAAEIGSGKPLSEIANERGISTGTARWHLKNVQAKTDTHRLAELVRLVGRAWGKISGSE